METSLVGKVCPYCQSPIKPGANVVVCSACGIPHHAECWNENGRCTTYGCTGTATTPPDAPSSSSPPLGAQSFTSPPQPTFTGPGQEMPAKTSGLAIAALILGLLGLCSFGGTALIGLILGIVALTQFGNPRLRGRGMAIAGVIVSAVFMLLPASILFPVFSKARAKAQQATCNSNVRQLALAIQMYAQDNMSQYPGVDGGSWPGKIAPYLGSSAQMFQCPSDKSGDSGKNSYAMAGLLVRQDGSGVKEAQVLSPSEVGAICDATPSETYPAGRLIGGGASQPIDLIGATIATRHSKGAIVGYCDGHAKYTYMQGAINLKDESNSAVRAMYHVAPLGLIDNPVGMWPADAGITGFSDTLTVGGEYATYPLLMAAAKVHGDFYTSGFKGQNYKVGRPKSRWVWGTASISPDKVAGRAIAYDAVCIIVAKGSKIPDLPVLANSTYAMEPSAIRQIFQKGYQQDVVQVYQLPGAYCSTNAYVKKVIGYTSIGAGSVEVSNDAEMVDKVSNDPWGIGYCSSAFADPDRVTVLAPIIGGKTYVWPRSSEKFRWVMPTYAESDWPWKRSLDVTASPDRLGAGFASAMRTGAFGKGLRQSPLFTWGYWAGNY